MGGTEGISLTSMQIMLELDIFNFNQGKIMSTPHHWAPIHQGI